MSSDSEDDCYGNIAQKLQSMKSKYQEDKIETSNFLLDSNKTASTSKKVEKAPEVADTSVIEDSEVLNNDSDVEEISLDVIIAQNRSKRLTRSCKRNADISADNILPTRRRKTAIASKKANNTVSLIPDLDSSNQSDVSDIPTVPIPPFADTVDSTRGRRLGRGSKRGRGRGRGKASSSVTSNTTVDSLNTASATINAANVTVNATNVNVNATNVTVNIMTTATAPANTTATATNAAANNPEHDHVSRDSSSHIFDSTFNRPRGRRSRNWRQRSPQIWDPFYYSIFNAGRSRSRQNQTSYPTYSVGNTAEYPDDSHYQPLFTNPPKTDDVVVLGDNEAENSIDENEELSVKVYWQNREYVKFPLRRFQKLTQIFEFFAKREQVSQDKLFFTYNDKVLKIDDTPDSITYNIVKFIDGGVINQSVSNFIRNDRASVKNGIKLKFQCQNVKKPYETTVQLDDKMAVAMMMCAEHWEKPLEKLKFYFDGDLITGKSTPRELELEGGECIDVKISS